MPTNPGWKCPKCGREFVRRSVYHGCGNYTVEGYLAGKNPEAVALFNLLVKTAQQIAPTTLSAAKTQISFRANSTFLRVSVTGRQLVGYIVLPREAPAPFFTKIVAASSRRFGHMFRIADPAIITGPFAKFIAESIAMGTEPKKPTATKSRRSSIGEEINAIYRADRTQRPHP